MDTPRKPTLQENLSRNRYLRALALYAITLLIGFVLFKLANTHVISGWLYYANLLAFGWVGWKVAAAVYDTQKPYLGHRLALVLGVLVWFVIFGLLSEALRRMTLDIIHKYFDEPAD
jgi:hypothetical protein